MPKNDLNNICSELKDDLLSLYCKVKHSSIEDTFIRLAEGTGDGFVSWFKENDKVLRTKVKDKRIIDLLNVLYDFRSVTPKGEKLDRSYASKYILNTSGASNALGLLWSLYNIMQSGAFGTILSPFSSVINDATNIFFEASEKAKVDVGTVDVEDDLKIIQDFYIGNTKSKSKTHTRKPSAAQQKINMLKNLLTMFSNEIANAFEKQGMSDVAQKFRENILIKPAHIGIGSILQVNNLNTDQITAAKLLSDLVWKNNYEERWINYNHDMIETTLLNKSKALSNEEYNKIVSKYEHDKNIMDEIDGESEIKPWLDKGISHPIDKKINPDYIFSLVLFFAFLLEKTK